MNQNYLEADLLEPLRALEKETGRSIVPVLLEAYLNDAVRMVSGLEQALCDHQYEDAARFAHSLKSSSAYVGAIRIRDLCAKIEKEILDTKVFKTEDIELWGRQISESLTPTLDAVKKLL